MPSTLLLETLCIKESKVEHISYHNWRFNQSRRELFGIESFCDLAPLLTPPTLGTYRCRILYGRTIESIEYIPYQPKEIKRVALVRSAIEYSYKYANRRELDALKESSPKSDDIVIIQDGLITDTSIANIAFLENGQWITPKKPLLKGTTRQRLLESGFLREKNIPSEIISSFDGVALMNAMVGFKIISPIWMKAEVHYG